jgi:hypothetical protein
VTTVPNPTTTTIPEPPCVPGPGEIVDENGDCIHIEIPEPDPCASHPELHIDVCQPPQDNEPISTTPGAPEEPHVPDPGPTPVPDTPAPPPTDGGYDSGSPDGSGTPDDSECDEAGNCSGGGPTPDPDGNEPIVDDGTHSGDPGGF